METPGGSSHGAGVLPECSAAITGEKKTFTVELTPPTTPIDFIEWSFTDRNDVSTIIISTNTGPNPDYQDRIHVFPETGSLELRNLILSDIGDYKVIIRVGEVQQTGSCFLYLHELIGGVGIKHTSTDLLESSGSVTMTCFTTAGTDITYGWLNSTNEVKAGDRVQITEGGSKLTITNVNRYDTGPYRCRVSNLVSSSTSGPVELDISYGPENISLSTSPSLEHHKVGSNINLTCSSESNPPAVYQWFFNGALLPVLGPELRLKNVLESQSGNYRCQAYNNKTLNSLTQSTPLSILTPISRVELRTDTTDLIEFSGPVSLLCSATGSSPSFRWANGSSEITKNDRVQITDGGSKLTILNINRYDKGPFRCHAFNPINDGTSNPVVLSVNYGPENINLTKTPFQEHYNEGSDVDLLCSATSVPPPQFRWLKNGELLSHTGPALQLKNIHFNQRGNYSCQAFNDRTQRTVTSDPVSISVIRSEISNVVIIPSKTEMEEFSGSVSLTCTYEGLFPNFVWRNSSSELIAGDGVQIESKGAVVIILNVSRYDEGPYTCHVFNNFSSATSPPLKLSIYYGPENISVSTSPLLQYHPVGSNIHLSCSSGSRPPAVYQWFFNGELLPVSGSELSLRNVLETQSGNYRCQAYNTKTLKSQTKSSTITILTPISRVELRTDTTDLIEFSGAVSLFCSATGSSPSFRWANGSSEITNNDRVQITNGGSKLTILNISRHDTGPFRCHAFNLISNDTSNPVVLSVYYGPENINLTKTPFQEHYNEGSDVDLLCSASSVPPPQIRWFKNGELLSHTGPALQLKNIRFHQRGNYSCQAFNDKTLRTQTSEPVAISVIKFEISNVVIIPSKTEMEEFSGSVSLTCTFDGVSTNIIWRKGSFELTAGDGVQIESKGAVVTILNVSRHDEGPYTCQVFNDFSSATSPPLKLSIYYGPENISVSTSPSLQYHSVGSNIHLSCSSGSRPPAVYHWFFNGGMLPGSGSELSLRNVLESQSGNYRCRAYNNKTMKSQTQSSTITILTPISRVELRTDTTDLIEFSGPVSLVCSATGSSPSFRWANGSSEITNNNRVQITNGGTKLTILNISRHDTGPFRCHAFNLINSDTSNPVVLSVYYGPENIKITKSPVQEHYYEGSNVDLVCSASSSPPPQFRWFKNGELLSHSGPALQLKNIHFHQRGNYSCQAFNNKTQRTITSEPLAISVISLEISNVVIIPSKTEMEEFSGSVSLNCSFKGLFPTFAWRNGSSQLTAGDGVQINNNGALVTILNVSRYDEGPYTCQVFNNFSSATSPPLKLSIYYGPENVYFEIFPPREYFETGSKISMSCSAASRPPALFQWYQNGYLLPYTGSKLNLVNVQEHHSGNYSCRAFNNKTLKYQTTRPSAIIILTPVSNVTLTASPQVMFEFSSTTLYCSSAGTAVSYRWLNGSLEVTADHRVQITNGGSKLTIVSVTRYEETAFRCNVSNAVSDRLSQALHLYIQYGPDYVTIEGPDSVYVGHYAVLLCTTSSVPTASFTWLFNGKPTGVHTAKYVIDLSRSSDAGMYVCTATNAITGRCATGSHNLTVSDLPVCYTSMAAGVGAAITILCLILLVAVILLIVFCVSGKCLGTCVKHSDTYNVSDRPSSSANAEEKGKPT
ncbi:hemicentin-1-like isoform X2 [Corythoichthys intestinalis]|uniref:hemicentin-1-like isoform X2 n=1 Tax=Corythoichthys intestinalis TaxID=161448 RepID=UPI0025A611A9|nr:hemicentin-1-like isoform X2 [Corythoichthys intestinalis]